MGNISLRYALTDSRNVPAVMAFQANNNEKIKKFAQGLGIKPEVDSNGYIHEAHALGAFNGASPLQIAGAYAAFSNGGTYYEPYSVSRIILRNSNEKIDFEPEGERAMSEATAYMVTDVLKGVASHNNIYLNTTDQYAMKTGTTNYDEATARKYGYSTDAAPDGWIAGFTPNISLAMWTGYVKNKQGVYLTMNQMYSHRNALYTACAKAIFNNTGDKWKKPSSVIRVKVVKGTEQLASATTPSSMVTTELFKRGHAPKTTSTKYNQLPNPSGLTLSFNSGTVSLSWHAARKPSDSDSSFGAFGYNVYLNGQLLGFTTGTSYTYSGSNPFGTYTVKTAYKNTTTNMSSGISKSLSQKIDIKTNVESSVTIKAGEGYSISTRPFTVYENGVDVTSSATVSHTISGPGGSTDFSKPGTYTIKYTVKYDGESDTATTTVTVLNNEPEDDDDNGETTE